MSELDEMIMMRKLCALNNWMLHARNSDNVPLPLQLQFEKIREQLKGMLDAGDSNDMSLIPLRQVAEMLEQQHEIMNTHGLNPAVLQVLVSYATPIIRLHQKAKGELLHTNSTIPRADVGVIIKELEWIDTVYQNFDECTKNCSPEKYLPMTHDTLNIISSHCCNLFEGGDAEFYSYNRCKCLEALKRNPMLWMPEYLLHHKVDYINKMTYRYPNEKLLQDAVLEALSFDKIPPEWKNHSCAARKHTTAHSRYQFCDQYLWNLFAILVVQKDLGAPDMYNEKQINAMKKTCEESIWNQRFTTRKRPNQFGISIKSIKNRELQGWANKSLFPIAPLVLYERFAFMGKRKTLAHKLSRQYLVTFENEDKNHAHYIDCLMEPDALYYELCTGVSLTSEITALLLEFQTLSKKLFPKSANGNAKYITNSLLALLGEHREFIVNCPLVFWRSSVLREILEEIYYKICDSIQKLQTDGVTCAEKAVEQSYIESFFCRLLGLKLNEINIRMLPVASRTGWQYGKEPADAIEKMLDDCDSVLKIEELLLQVIYPTRPLELLSEQERTLVRYEAIAYQSGECPPEDMQAYKLLYKTIIEHKGAPIADTSVDIHRAIRDDFDQTYKDFCMFFDAESSDSLASGHRADIPYHPDITWRIAKRRMDEAQKAGTTQDTVELSSTDFKKALDTFPYVQDELDKIRSDYMAHLNSPWLERGEGIFRYCDMSHKNMKLIRTEAEETKILDPKNYRVRTEVHQLFEQVRKTLYPNGYIDFKL